MAGTEHQCSLYNHCLLLQMPSRTSDTDDDNVTTRLRQRHWHGEPHDCSEEHNTQHTTCRHRWKHCRTPAQAIHCCCRTRLTTREDNIQPQPQLRHSKGKRMATKERKRKRERWLYHSLLCFGASDALAPSVSQPQVPSPRW